MITQQQAAFEGNSLGEQPSKLQVDGAQAGIRVDQAWLQRSRLRMSYRERTLQFAIAHLRLRQLLG